LAILIPIIKYIFNPSVSLQQLPTQWQQSVIFYIYKRGNKANVPLTLLNNFSKVFEFVMLHHSYYYFKCKLNSYHHGFFQSKLTIINVVSYLDFTAPLVCS
jgi:hypothetical protein